MEVINIALRDESIRGEANLDVREFQLEPRHKYTDSFVLIFFNSL